jgi:hypothetical protein
LQVCVFYIAFITAAAIGSSAITALQCSGSQQDRLLVFVADEYKLHHATVVHSPPMAPLPPLPLPPLPFVVATFTLRRFAVSLLLAYLITTS